MYKPLAGMNKYASFALAFLLVFSGCLGGSDNDLNTEDDLAEMVRAVWEQKHSYWYSLQCLKAHEAKLSQIASSSQSQPQSATSENRASALEAFQTNELLRITGQEDAR